MDRPRLINWADKPGYSYSISMDHIGTGSREIRMYNKIENIFLCYSNSPVKDNPESLLKLYEDLWSYSNGSNTVASHKRPKTIRELTLKVMVSIAKKEDETERDAQKIVEEYLKGDSVMLESKYPWDSVYEIAHDAVYGFQNGYCENECSHRNRRTTLSELGEGLFIGSDRLKCYECDRLWFMWIVSEIIRGKDFSEIDGFPDLISMNEKCTWTSIGLAESDRNPHFKTILKEKRHFVIPGTSILEHRNTGHGKDIFNSFIRNIVAFSIIGFLLDNDRRRLKYCSVCDDFFVAKDIKLKVCYPPKNCKKVYKSQDNVRRMREDYRNPTSPKFKVTYL